MDIFISYTTEDQERVEPIVTVLKNQGWQVFWDRNIPVGETWHNYIGDALKNASCVLVIWSEHSITSQWVMAEAEAAKKKNAYVPVLIDDVDPPLGFTNIQAADLTSWNGSISDPMYVHLSKAITSRFSPKKAPSVEQQPNSEQSRKNRLKSIIISFLKQVKINHYLFFFVLLIVLYFVIPIINIKSDNVHDIDGNVYKTVTIGNQIWMIENLNVSHYRNGDEIPQVRNADEWSLLTTGAWCYYNNDPTNGRTFGKLYNWFAINDPRGLAPEGWHIPTDGEWQELERHLGMSWEDINKVGLGGRIGGKLKEIGTNHWNNPNKGATNESGFTALAAGDRASDGTFNFIGKHAFYWSSSNYNNGFAWNRKLYYDNSGINRYFLPMQCGFSVRCIKD